MNVSTPTLILIIILFILVLMYILPYNKESFSAGLNARFEPEFNERFEKCLKNYPPEFGGGTNEGWYTCLRSVENYMRRKEANQTTPQEDRDSNSECFPFC